MKLAENFLNSSMINPCTLDYNGKLEVMKAAIKTKL